MDKNNLLLHEVEMSDHEFAAWLVKNNWHGDCYTNHTNNVNYFMVAGKVIATTLNDNQTCTRHIFIKAE